MNTSAIVQSNFEFGFHSGKSQTLVKALEEQFQDEDRRVAKALVSKDGKTKKRLRATRKNKGSTGTTALLGSTDVANS